MVLMDGEAHHIAWWRIMHYKIHEPLIHFDDTLGMHISQCQNAVADILLYNKWPHRYTLTPCACTCFARKRGDGSYSYNTWHHRYTLQP